MKQAAMLICVMMGSLLALANDRPAEPAQQSTTDAAGRQPLPLLQMMADHQKQNMRDHLLAVQEIVIAVSSEDYEAIAQSAGRIGYSQQMAQMCTHMGAAAPAFTEQALVFHHTADRIAEAARARDRSRVLVELGATLQTCTACHAAWKQQVVDETTWNRLTSVAQPAAGAHP
jgi:hypothetical protein